LVANSRGVLVVVTQEPAQPLATLYSFVTTSFRDWAAEPRHLPSSFHYGQRAVGRRAMRVTNISNAIDEYRAKRTAMTSPSR
jgi:hypothetical protein